MNVRRSALFASVLLSAVTAACTGAKQSVSPPSTTPTSASPSSSSSVCPDSATDPHIALLAGHIKAGQWSYDTIKLYTLNRELTSSTALPVADPVMTVGGDQVFYVLNGHLRSVRASGTACDYGRLPGANTSPSNVNGRVTGLVASTDGRRWAWNVEDWHADGSISTTIYIAGVGRAPRVLLRETSPPSAYEIVPIKWTTSGIVLAYMGVGRGGLVFFQDSYWSETKIIDPDSGSLRGLTTTKERCALNDLASDGSWTCVTASTSSSAVTSWTVIVHKPDGTEESIQVSPPAEQVGNGILSGSRLAVGVYEGFQNNSYYKLRTVLYDGTGAPTLLSDGVVPAGWLPNGALVVWDADFSNPASQGSFLIGQGGNLLRVGLGKFIGYLSSGGSVPAASTF